MSKVEIKIDLKKSLSVTCIQKNIHITIYTSMNFHKLNIVLYPVPQKVPCDPFQSPTPQRIPIWTFNIIDLFRFLYFVYIKPFDMFSLVSGCFCLSLYLWYSSTLLHIITICCHCSVLCHGLNIIQFI